MTRYEKDYRATYYQASLAIKITAAQLVNSIVVPIFVNYFTFDSIYEPGGISDDIFYFAFTNALVSPLLRLLDFRHRRRDLMRCYSSRPINKIGFGDQLEYNRVWEGDEFEVGYEYVYLLQTTLYTCFFISLQPIIAVLSTIGILLYLAVVRYALFYWCQRPKASSSFVNKTLNRILRLSMLAYAVGMMCWTHFAAANRLRSAMIPTVLALILAAAVYYWSDNLDQLVVREEVPLSYERSRIFLNSEYDRVNPATRKKALREFKQYIECKQIENVSEEKRNVTNYLNSLFAQHISQPIERRETAEQSIVADRIVSMFEQTTNQQQTSNLR